MRKPSLTKSLKQWIISHIIIMGQELRTHQYYCHCAPRLTTTSSTNHTQKRIRQKNKRQVIIIFHVLKSNWFLLALNYSAFSHVSYKSVNSEENSRERKVQFPVTLFPVRTALTTSYVYFFFHVQYPSPQKT